MSEVLPDLSLRKSEKIAAAVAVGILLAQIPLRPPLLPIPDDPLGYFLMFNTGDFGNAYWSVFSLDWGFRSEFPLVSALKRRTISGLLTTAALVAVESGPHIFGRSDVMDIPAGLAGAACCLGVSIWAMRQKK